jgi:UDP-N-acetylenolpyruvoylglucosamine reductase
MLPASIGGAIVMNAGAFGKQISDVVERVGVLRNGKVI